MNVTVVGTGYVGLVTGACLADAGNTVFCLDLDERKIARLNGGELREIDGTARTAHKGITNVAFSKPLYIRERAYHCCGGGGSCHVGIRDADQVGAIWVNLDLHLRAVGTPIVPQHGDSG